MGYDPDWFMLRLLGENHSVDLNASAPTDFEMKISDSAYLPKYLFIHSVSAAAASATVGIYTATGGGGTAVLAPTALSTLTAANKCAVIDLAPFVDQLTASSLYLRLTVAAGSAATCHVGIYGFNCE